MSDSSDESILDGDDYYTHLNIPRDASTESITNAYHRLSKLYHPDKHHHPERKKEAELLFGKIKKAYEVLSDGHQRAIYDSLGVKGLNTQGWEVVKRTKTPQEIREEYERLAREREEHRLMQRTNPKSNVTVSINATELFSPSGESYTFDLRDLVGLPHVEVSGLAINQSIDLPITSRLSSTLSGQLTSHNGRGTGSMNFALRHITSEKSWVEMETGLGPECSFALKLFRRISDRIYCNAAVQSSFATNGIRLGSVFTLACQLEKHTMGYLTWKLGMNSSLSTMIINDTEEEHRVLSWHFGLPHSYVSLSYTRKIPDRNYKFKVNLKLGTFGGMLEYSAEKRVTQHTFLSSTVCIGGPLGVHLKLRCRRATQTYTSNIVLSDEPLWAPILYGTALPLVSWAALDWLVLQPYLAQQKKHNLARKKELNKERINKLRREGAAATQLMKETVKRIREVEENKKGLVIIRAIYGQFAVTPSEAEELEDDLLDVTVPLQCLVKDSKLVLQDASKSQLPGFFDPCPGESKNLYVEYLFHAVVHKVMIKDCDGLKIPKQSHRVQS